MSVSPRAVDFQKKLTAFMEEHIYDAEAKISAHALQEGAARWTISPEIPRLQKLAKEQGLWNLWIPKDLDPKGELGQGLTNQEYATLAEIMGAVPWASEIFNCSVNCDLGTGHGQHGGAAEVRNRGAEGRVAAAAAGWQVRELPAGLCAMPGTDAAHGPARIRSCFAMVSSARVRRARGGMHATDMLRRAQTEPAVASSDA
eukprot:547368-Rhodomonas_salina.1